MKKKNNGYLDKDLIPRLFIGADLIIREAFEIFVSKIKFSYSG
jgi:hypothetical protein